jgi:hypothetical protein
MHWNVAPGKVRGLVGTPAEAVKGAHHPSGGTSRQELVFRISTRLLPGGELTPACLDLAVGCNPVQNAGTVVSATQIELRLCLVALWGLSHIQASEGTECQPERPAVSCSHGH